MYLKSTLFALSLLASLAVAPIINSDIPADNSSQIINKTSDDLVAYRGWRVARAQARGNYNDGYYGYNDGYGRGYRGYYGFRGGYSSSPGYYSRSNYYNRGYYDNNNRGFGLFSGGLFGCGCCGC